MNKETYVEEHSNVRTYIQSKLPLFFSFKNHFESVRDLPDLLLAHMSLREILQPSKEINAVTKKRLVEAGVYDDQEILEFLLLIAEKPRSLTRLPKSCTDEEKVKMFFEQYRSSEERWNSATYHFFLHEWPYIDHSDYFEGTALRLIAHSRSDEAEALELIPQPAAELIKKADDYFQRAFPLVFGGPAPLRLTEVTRLTTKRTGGWANKISGKSYVHEEIGNGDHFMYIVLHEGTHLCFEGFKEINLEEALVEYFLGKMHQVYPPENFGFKPVCEPYQQWKIVLGTLMEYIPGLENKFKEYFLGGDVRDLKKFLARRYTSKIKQQIENLPESRHYGITHALNDFVTDK